MNLVSSKAGSNNAATYRGWSNFRPAARISPQDSEGLKREQPGKLTVQAKPFRIDAGSRDHITAKLQFSCSPSGELRDQPNQSTECLSHFALTTDGIGWSREGQAYRRKISADRFGSYHAPRIPQQHSMLSGPVYFVTSPLAFTRMGMMYFAFATCELSLGNLQ